MASDIAIATAWRNLLDCGVRLPDGWDNGRALDVWLAVLADVADEDLHAATLAYLRTPRPFWPMPGDIVQHIRPPASREDVAATAADDLAYLLAGYRLCGSIEEVGALADAILPAEGQPLRTRPVMSETEIPCRFTAGRMVTSTRRAFPPCPADLAARHDRIRGALGRIGGLEEVRRVMRAEDEGRALAGLGHSWRAVYASNASEAQRAASPGLRVIEGGRRMVETEPEVARQDARDVRALVDALSGGMPRGGR